MAKEKFTLERAKSPEEVGVSSKEVVEFLRDMKENKLEFHSFMVIKNNKVACELYRAPFNKETPHSAYSISKTVTAIAAGFAIEEGLFNLDTRIVDVFPEYIPEKVDGRIFKVTVRNLLTMTAGVSPNLFLNKNKTDWLEEYFKSSFYGEPGTFRYVNENIFVLSAMICRLSKTTLREYLTPRLFAPLGIDFPEWETNQDGIEAGGWGLSLKLEDLAKIMYCLSNNGKVEKKQIIPENWVLEMTDAHADTSICKNIDTDKGYGYCVWRNGGNQSYRANGMFSQFGIVFPEENAVLVCFGAIASEQEARDCVWRHFPKAFIEPDKRAKEPAYEDFYRIADEFKIDNPSVSIRSLQEAKLNNKTIEIKRKVLLNLIGFPVSVIPFTVTFLNGKRAGNIDNINFTFKEKECLMSWCEGNEKNTITCGMDGHLRYGDITLAGVKYKVCCYAEWDESDILKVNIRPIETASKRKLKFTFVGTENLIMKPLSTPKVKDMAVSLVGAASEVIDNDLVVKVMQKATKYVPWVLEPRHKGKLVGRKDIY
ncbi:MAG: serine hydrolase [Ruminococcaceae bacterium]|nr:serine hydrolase [Oscillospiraceae bacterium]